MNCAWKELLAVLPPKLRSEVDALCPHSPQEIRLRIDSPPEVVTASGSCILNGTVRADDLNFIVNTASRYSPWAASSIAKGYITAPGGHRIGICGDAVIENGIMKGIRTIRYLCIRIAKDYVGISKSLKNIKGSFLILGAPGWGKTTFLRDLIRTISENHHISVVDERGELFPSGFQTGCYTDILTNCPKTIGIEMVLRTMGPDYIAVDEVTAQEDCEALAQAANCGVNLLATIHASSLQDANYRAVYRSLLNTNIFKSCIIMSKDKSWKMERI